LASRSIPKGPFNVAPEKQQTATPPSALAAMTKLLTEPLIQTDVATTPGDTVTTQAEQQLLGIIRIIWAWIVLSLLSLFCAGTHNQGVGE
jgi:hypothetical protein